MKLFRRFTTLFRRNRIDDELRREMEFHVAMEAAERERRGDSATEAHRLARADFGAVASVREDVRDARGLTFWDHLVQDVRFGIRLLVRQPGFSAIAIVILALGIGANTAVFSIVNVLLLKPRPWHADGEIVGVYYRDTTQPDQYRAFSYPDFDDMRARTDVFASVTTHNFAFVGLDEGAGAVRRVIADVTSASFFDLFGTPPIRGRSFTLEEERPGAEIPVAILSYATWQRMGGGESVLGSTIRLNTRPFTVIGVAAKGFGGSIAVASPEVWVPTGVYDTITNDFFRRGLASKLGDRNHHTLLVMARLRRGATRASVSPGLDSVSTTLVNAAPAENTHFALELAPLARMSLSTKPVDDGPAITGISVAMLSMAAVVLLVASFNLANMLLARSDARRKEFAIRLAIGGSRTRLIRQLLTEGMVLAAIGGVAGLWVSSWATQALIAGLTPLSPVSISFDATPDWRIVSALVAYCSLSTVVFAMLPARRLSRTNPGDELKGHTGEWRAARRRRFAMPGVLVMGQLALSCVLLTVAALFVRSAAEAANVDPGFTFDRGVLMQIDPAMAGYPAERGRDIFSAALERLRSRHDVAAASVSTIMPLGDLEDDQMVQRAGAPVLGSDPEKDAKLLKSTYTGIGTGYFDAVGLTLVAGRDFTPAEEQTPASTPRVAIINAALAQKLFGDANPLGQEIQYSARDTAAPPVVLTVVGVAPGVRYDLFDLEPKPGLYVPFGSAFQSGSYLHVRTRAASASAEAALLPAFRQVLAGIDPKLPILSLETRAMFRDRNLLVGVVRIAAVIFAVFGAVALLLATVGVYGVKAYVVARRTREIGIRIALGATPRRVVWMVVRDGLVASIVGLAVGLALSALAGAAMRNLSFQGRVADATIVTIALAVLMSAALLASWIPARRATKIEPLRAIRE